MDRDTKKRLIEGVIFTVALILSGVIFYTSESAGYFRFHCPIRNLFHIECPGCGGTRMITSILSLDFYKAFRSHNFVFLTIPYVIYLYIRSLKDYILTGALKNKTLKYIIIYLGLFVIYTIIRNIPGFEVLKPIKL